MPSWIERPIAGVTRVGIALRKRFSPVDHLWRAWVRSEEVNVGRLAAATAYYGFFAILAVAVTGFAVLGQVFQNNTLVVDAISAYLKENLPQLETRQLIASAGKLGIVAGFALMFAGVAWVENLRSSQRALWRLQQQPGNLVVRWLVDLGVLIGLGLLLLISVSVFAGVQDLLLRLSDSAEHSLIRIVLGGSNVLLGGLVDLLLGAALLVGVPRVRMPMRRLIPAALTFAGGFWLLKTIGRLYITRTENNPAYQVAAGAVGLLVFMYLLHRVLLFAAALAATSTHGEVRDLAVRRGAGA